MKPNPFWELNHLTIPVCIFPLRGETPDWRAHTMRERRIDVLDVGCGWCTRSAVSRAIRPKLDALYIVVQALNCKESSAGVVKAPISDRSYLRVTAAGMIFLTSRLARLRGPQSLRKRLQELPSNGRVPFDEWTKLPEREPETNEIGGSSHCGRPGAAVDQGDFAEIVARAKRGKVNTFARDLGLPGIDEKEGGTPRTLHNDGLALFEGTLLEQAGDLLGLPPVHIGEELDAPECGHGVTAGRAGR